MYNGVVARMVEIGVYSTVGASEPELPKFRGVSAGKYGKRRGGSLRQRQWNGQETA